MNEEPHQKQAKAWLVDIKQKAKLYKKAVQKVSGLPSTY